MGQWLTSGRRRDICVLLYGTDGVTTQDLKRRLEDHYEVRLDPGSFRSTLAALVDAGHVERTVDGVHDRYALTEAGRAALEAHDRWRRDQLRS